MSGTQLGAILGVPPDNSSLDRIATLADGNPFYVEELADLDVDSGSLPRSLRDVLLARLDRLDDPTIDVLGRAAVIGRDVDERLLVAVSERPEAEVRGALRAAIENHVLESAPGGRRHRFRHALLREAVLDGLLASEQVALHRRVAEALEARPELAAASPAAAAAELAYHWSEATDQAKAFPALLESGRRAQAARAWTEASDAFERAAALGAAAGSLAPIDVAELRMRAALLADFAGDLARGLELGRAAMEADDGQDARRSGALLNTLGTLASDAGDFDLSIWANEEALRLIPVEPPSFERAKAVSTLGARRMIQNRNREAIVIVDEGLAQLRTADRSGALGAALGVKGLALASLGRVEESRAAIEEARSLYDRMGDDDAYDASSIATNGSYALLVLGDFDGAVRFIDSAMERAAGIGAERGWGIWLEPIAALAAFLIGDWEATSERLGRFAADSDAGFPLLDTLMSEAELAAGRGQRALVETLLAVSPGAPVHHWFSGQFERVRAVAALWDGDPRAAASMIDASIAIMATQEEVQSLLEILKVAVRAHADIAASARASRAADEVRDATARVAELATDVAATRGGDVYGGCFVDTVDASDRHAGGG